MKLIYFMFRKSIKWFFIVLISPIGFFLLLIRPLFRIQFVMIPSTAIGHFAGNVDNFLIDQMVNSRKKTYYIFYYPLNTKPVNNQLHLMWSRVIFIVTKKWITKGIVALELLSDKISPLGKIFYNIRGDVFDAGDRDKTGVMAYIPPFLKFTPDEVVEGEKALEKMGIPKGAKFIVMHSRDRAFLATQYFRNTEIETFFQAAKYFFERGYYVIRTGARVTNPIPESEYYLIDYATKFRTEFLDLYLSARCDFYFGDSCGFFALSTCFRKPLAITNQSPLLNGPYFYQKAVLLPKKYWLRTEKRYMPLAEIIEKNLGHLYGEENYEMQGIEVHSNTPDEILSFAVEIELRFNNKFLEIEKEKNMQDFFRKKVSSVDIVIKPNGAVRCKLSSSFVEKNSYFLQDS